MAYFKRARWALNLAFIVWVLYATKLKSFVDFVWWWTLRRKGDPTEIEVTVFAGVKKSDARKMIAWAKSVSPVPTKKDRSIFAWLERLLEVS